MTEGFANQAIQAVLNSQQAYCKFLSANDSGATGGHQSGILVSKSAKDMMFSQALENENILKRTVDIQWQNDIWTESSFTYYSSKNELRITKFGRSFPFLNPEQTGALFVLTRQSADQYSAFFLETEDDIEQFLSAFGIGPTETNHMIDTSAVLPERQERIAIQEFIDTLTVDFPLSDVMSAAARDIQNRVYNHLEYIRTNPDRKIIEWTNTEYALFRAIEHARYGDKISRGADLILSQTQLLERSGSPSGIREIPRLVRMKSLQPRSCSRLFMQRVILGWLLPNTSAARVKLLCWAT